MAQIGGARPVGPQRRLDPLDQLARMVLGAVGEPPARAVPGVAHRTGLKHPVGGHVGGRGAQRLRERAGLGGAVHLHQRPWPALPEHDAGGILRARAEPSDPVVPFECAPSRRFVHVASLSTIPDHPFGRWFSGSMNTGSVIRTGTKLAVSGDAAQSTLPFQSAASSIRASAMWRSSEGL